MLLNQMKCTKIIKLQIKIFTVVFLVFNESDLRKIEHNENINKIMFNNWTKLKELICSNDVIILGAYRNVEWIVSYARIKNKIVFCHKKPT